jgi:hypothetical protein
MGVSVPKEDIDVLTVLEAAIFVINETFTARQAATINGYITDHNNVLRAEDHFPSELQINARKGAQEIDNYATPFTQFNSGPYAFRFHKGACVLTHRRSIMLEWQLDYIHLRLPALKNIKLGGISRDFNENRSA